jgi:hypothetical protein
MAKTIDDVIAAYLAKREEKEVKRLSRKQRQKKSNVCVQCKEVFTGHKRLFCTRKCYAKSVKEKYLSSRQLQCTEERTCKSCGNKFVAVRELQTYCTAKCRQEKWNKIYREKYAIAFGVKREA